MTTVRTQDLPDPNGSKYGIPTYYWGTAPAGLATRRQLRADGKQPNRQPYVARAVRPRRGDREPLVAHLYRVEDAAPKKPPTSAQLAAVARATRAHQEQAMLRHGVDPHEFDDERSGGGWHDEEDEVESEDFELEESEW